MVRQLQGKAKSAGTRPLACAWGGGPEDAGAALPAVFDGVGGVVGEGDGVGDGEGEAGAGDGGCLSHQRHGKNLSVLKD